MLLKRREVLRLLGGIAGFCLPGCGGGGTPPPVTRAAQQQVGFIVRELFHGGKDFAWFYVYNAVVSHAGSLSPGLGFGADDIRDTSHTIGLVPTLQLYSTPVVLVDFTTRVPQGRSVQSTKTETLGTGLGPDGLGIGTLPMPSFYFDTTFQLWVENSYKDGESHYDFFEDEGKTKPAGEIVWTWEPWLQAYPQVWQERYSYLAGPLKGAHGSAVRTANADGSCTFSYESVFATGVSVKGRGAFNANKDISWSHHSETPDGKSWSDSSGSRLGSGAEEVHITTSEGYQASMVSDKSYAVIKGPSGVGTSILTWTASLGQFTGSWLSPDPFIPSETNSVTIHFADGTRLLCSP